MGRLSHKLRIAALFLGLLAWVVPPSGAAAQTGGQGEAMWATAVHGYPPGTIIGVVYDSESREGLSGAQVFLDGTGIGTLTDALGRFTLRGAAPGNVTLGVALVGYGLRRGAFVLEVDGALAVTIALDHTRVSICGLVVCAGPFGCYSFQVVVRDLLTGVAPLSDVTLTIRGRQVSDSMSLRATPGERFLHLGAGDAMVRAGPGRDPGPYVIEVSAPGYVPWMRAEVERGSCGEFTGNPHPVWLVPVRSDGSR